MAISDVDGLRRALMTTMNSTTALHKVGNYKGHVLCSLHLSIHSLRFRVLFYPLPIPPTPTSADPLSPPSLLGQCRADVFPYFMLQGQITHNHEGKVVCFGGEPQYVSKSSKKGILGKVSKDVLFDFCRGALVALKRAVPSFSVDCLTRVDVFQRSDGRLVVNEFESLDACYAGALLCLSTTFHFTPRSSLSYSLTHLVPYSFPPSLLSPPQVGKECDTKRLEMKLTAFWETKLRLLLGGLGFRSNIWLPLPSRSHSSSSSSSPSSSLSQHTAKKPKL